jgi:hypothetical protein
MITCLMKVRETKIETKNGCLEGCCSSAVVPALSSGHEKIKGHRGFLLWELRLKYKYTTEVESVARVVSMAQGGRATD